MPTNVPDPTHAWTTAWLTAVASGAVTMSQRKRTSIEARGGGLDAVVALARAQGVHLALLVDDRGEELVAASTHPIRVLC